MVSIFLRNFYYFNNVFIFQNMFIFIINFELFFIYDIKNDFNKFILGD